MNPTERGKKLLEIVDRQGHLQERFASEFSTLSKYWYASQFMVWVTRNNDYLQKVLEVHSVPMKDLQNFVSVKREDVEFHLSNYLASVTGCRDYLFNWGKSSGIVRIDEITLQLKQEPTARILNAMRSSILHGARAFANWGVSMTSAIHPGGPGVNLTFNLSDTLTRKLSELPAECKEKVSEIKEAQENNLDWLGSLAAEGALLVKNAWSFARSAFYELHKDEFETREQVIQELKLLETEYHKIGPLPLSELGFPLKPLSNE